MRYLHNLQQNDTVARPTNWSLVLHDSAVRKKYGLTLSDRDKTKKTPHQHVWNRLSLNHYYVANTSAELQNQLDSGLLLPVLILPNSELGLSISSQSTWSGRTIESLLNVIFDDSNELINVQDHSKPQLGQFTTKITCEVVRARYRLSTEERGCSWNCMDLGDSLRGFKGPKPLEFGACLLNWQVANPKPINMNCRAYAPVQGAQVLDEWLLVSEKNSGSTAHVDIGVATWVSCLVGKKTFWIRNPSPVDQLVWSHFNIDDDHRLFSEPWARIDLYPGSVL